MHFELIEYSGGDQLNPLSLDVLLQHGSGAFTGLASGVSNQSAEDDHIAVSPRRSLPANSGTSVIEAVETGVSGSSDSSVPISASSPEAMGNSTDTCKLIGTAQTNTIFNSLRAV
jgi:hypothetical protein